MKLRVLLNLLQLTSKIKTNTDREQFINEIVDKYKISKYDAATLVHHLPCILSHYNAIKDIL